MRNAIERLVGQDAIDEIELWNDRKLESLEEYGVELSPEEEKAQAEVWSELDDETPM